MSIKALVFDLYGTLVSIRTDEQDPEIYNQISKFLSYNRVFIEPEQLKILYMEKIKLQLSKSREQYPDVNVLKVFTELMHEYSEGRMEPRIPLYTARLFRAFSRKTFEPFPGIYGMLERLRDHYPLALVSDV